MLVSATLRDLRQLTFEIEEADKSRLETMFFQFEHYPIPMEFTMQAARDMHQVLDEELRLQSCCLINLKEDKRYVVQKVSTGINVGGKLKFRL